eukprot:175195_1
MSYKVGDRVKIPKGAEGTVRYVGKVTFATGTHLGVELDDAVGDNNGKKKGKTYFKCKKQHGVIEKAAYFTASKGKRSKGRKSIPPKSKSKGGRASKAPNSLSAVTDEPEEKSSGRKRKGKGKSKDKESTPQPRVTTANIAIQTDVPKEQLAYVESEYYCKIITRLYTEENEKLRKQLDDVQSENTSLKQRTDTAESSAKQLEYELKQQSVELDPLREELEMKEVEIEELTIKLEIANLEIEELNEKLEDSLDKYVQNISADDKEHAEVIKLNQELQQQLATLVKVGQDLFDSKDKHINKLATESNYVDSLSARLKDLLSVEQEVLGLKSKVQQLSDKCGMLEDADRMCQQLTEYNNRLEGELTDWREWVLDVEAERAILEELNGEDDQHIIDLMKEKKDLEVQLVSLDKENKQIQIEKHDLEKEIFELRNKMERQDASAATEFEKYNFAPTDTAATASGSANPTDDNEDEANNPTDSNGDYVVVNPTDDAPQQPLAAQGQAPQQKESEDGDKRFQAVWNENLKLNSQIDDIRGILMAHVRDYVEGQGRYVEYSLMKQYLPADSTEVDYRGIAVLALLHKILYKAKSSRDLLERFYGEPSSALLANPNLAMMSHTLCPIILSQENYIRAIQRGFLCIGSGEVDAWKQKVLRVETPKFNKILETYDALLSAIEKSGESNELSFEIDKLANHEKVLKAFICKQFAEFSPDRDRKEEHRCQKDIVLHNISETHYRFQTLSIKLNQFNARLFDLVHAPSQTTRKMKFEAAAKEEEEDGKYDENSEMKSSDVDVSHELEVEDVLKILKIGAIEKLFRLRNDVMASTKQILQYCQPVELGFRKEKYTANLLRDGNMTAIKWSQLKQCKHISFKSVQRVTQMLDKLTSKVKMIHLPKKRVELINSIIEEEEEWNEEGLISVLERAYSIMGDVRKIIGSTLHTTISTTDDMPERAYDKFDVPFWENKSASFRVLFEKQKESQDKIAEQQEIIKQNEVAVAQVEKELKMKNQTIHILTEQNVKEREKSTKLAQIQRANKELNRSNEKFKGDILGYTAKISSQNEEIAAKSTAIEKYKKAIARIKEKESPLGKTQGSLSVDRQASTSNVNQDGGNSKSGTLLVDNEVEYSQLLEQTIQSLRRQVTELMMAKKVTNCELNLKPLPFTLLRDEFLQNLNEQMKKRKEKKHKKKKKKVKKKEKATEEEEEEDEKEEESEYEWVTDEEEEANETRLVNEEMARLKKLKEEAEKADNMRKKLNVLCGSLDAIRSQPRIIDLTQKRKKGINDLTQQIIGRQMKLRDVQIAYQKCKNEIGQNQHKKQDDD